MQQESPRVSAVYRQKEVILFLQVRIDSGITMESLGVGCTKVGF